MNWIICVWDRSFLASCEIIKNIANDVIGRSTSGISLLEHYICLLKIEDTICNVFLCRTIYLISFWYTNIIIHKWNIILFRVFFNPVTCRTVCQEIYESYLLVATCAWMYVQTRVHTCTDLPISRAEVLV